ncbi:hypothetical protein BDV26DRAFT_76448 [Aspergillus bertholletiae]|uniref:Uncharacterized protein n=1 Tax=Aspergillus bertholletiae TaxID=1226010 RepID=A0A5N7AT88_9EURO|nr:hypothetical protein BDV26DRAFT_76448 [Aspergillus bertholletiae]
MIAILPEIVVRCLLIARKKRKDGKQERQEKRQKKRKKKTGGDWRTSDTSSFATDAARCRCHLLSSMVSGQYASEKLRIWKEGQTRDKRKEGSVILSRGFTRAQIMDLHIMHGEGGASVVHQDGQRYLKVRLAFCC